MSPFDRVPLSGRYLSFVEREEIAILKAQGEGQAIQTVFQAIHDGRPDQALLAYQYLQMMPKIAEGDANKVWIVPSEITKALEGLGSSLNDIAGIPQKVDGPRRRIDTPTIDPETTSDASLSSAHAEVEKAIAAAQESSRGAAPTTPSAQATPPADSDEPAASAEEGDAPAT